MRALGLRTALIGLLAMAGACVSGVAQADSGTIRISVLKGGWFIGASGGSGTLTFHGRTYPLSIGGIDAGLVFGASQTNLSGRVTNIRRPSDVAGVYAPAGRGLRSCVGARAIVLTNEKGAVLHLSGRQTGLMLNADLKRAGDLAALKRDELTSNRKPSPEARALCEPRRATAVHCAILRGSPRIETQSRLAGLAERRDIGKY